MKSIQGIKEESFKYQFNETQMNREPVQIIKDAHNTSQEQQEEIQKSMHSIQDPQHLIQESQNQSQESQPGIQESIQINQERQEQIFQPEQTQEARLKILDPHVFEE